MFRSDPSHESSALHQTVSDMLQQMGCAHVCEHIATDESRFALDIAWPHLRTCLEVDGPFHFFSPVIQDNIALRLSGAHAQAAQRLLDESGTGMVL